MDNKNNSEQTQLVEQKDLENALEKSEVEEGLTPRKRFFATVDNILKKPFFVYTEGFLVAGLGVYTGAINERLFRLSTWNVLADNTTPDFRVIVYVVFAIYVLIVVVHRTRERNKATNELLSSSEELHHSFSEILKSSKDLNELVLTQPPMMFLQQFKQLFMNAKKTHYLALQTFNDSEKKLMDKQCFLAFSIRSILGSLCLIADFYNDHQIGDYTATTLWFVSTDSMDDAFKASVAKEIRFTEYNEPKQMFNHQGLLLLIKSLSYKRTGGDSEALDTNGNIPDKKVMNSIDINDEVHLLALPVPATPKRVLKDGSVEWYTLPGGPRCFVDGSVALLSDTKNIAEWCRQDSHLSEYTQEELVTYMNERSDDRFRAFLSIPIYSAISESEQPIGVINLESTQPGFFSARSLSSGNQELDDRRLTEFEAIAQPLVMLVEELIELYAQDRKSIISDYE